MRKTPDCTDSLVAENDFINLKGAINRGEFQKLVFEICEREPELGFGVSEQFDLVLTLLQGAVMTIDQRMIVTKHLSILTWSSLLVLDRAHRRAWDDFLPADDTTTEPKNGTDGGDL